MKLSQQQRRFVNATEKRRAFFGGRQSGKTTALLHYIRNVTVKDPTEVSVISPQHSTAMRLGREFREMIEPAVPKKSTRSEIVLQNGSRIRFHRSNDDYVGKAFSPDLICIDDAELCEKYFFKRFTESQIRSCDIAITCTETGKLHSVYADLINADWHFSVAPSSANPKVDRQTIRKWKDSVPEPDRAAFDLGTEIGDHNIFRPVPFCGIMLYKCIDCGQKEMFNLTEVENAQLAEKYIYGKFVCSPCDRNT